MSEMVERLARAIHLAECHGNQREADASWIYCNLLRRDQARAAIKAMREPTADMIDAGRDAPAHAPAGVSETHKVWVSMIDAALL